MVEEYSNLTISGKGTLPRVPFLAIKEAVLGKKYDLSIRFVEPGTALALNIAHRQKDYTPNTLSFSLSKTSGEIVLCRSAIRKEYKKFGMSYNTYMMFLVIHSSLHLVGMTHGSTMENKELFFLKKFAPTNETITFSRH